MGSANETDIQFEVNIAARATDTVFLFFSTIFKVYSRVILDGCSPLNASHVSVLVLGCCAAATAHMHQWMFYALKGRLKVLLWRMV